MKQRWGLDRNNVLWRHLEIPGVSNNTTGTLEQKKTNSWTPVGQATDKKVFEAQHVLPFDIKLILYFASLDETAKFWFQFLNEPRREKTCLRVCDQVRLKLAC